MKIQAMYRKLGLLAVLCLILSSSCKKVVEYDSSLSFAFTFIYGYKPLSLADSLAGKTPDSIPFQLNTPYKIASGQEITISEIQYFISEISLINDKNEKIPLPTMDFSHYVDISIPSTLKWTPRMPIPSGIYTGIEFVFGFTPAHNQTNQFVNPPESLMFWPQTLGGGYHYMKINGKWKAPDSVQMHNFGFHAGTGQTWENGIPISFHPNFFFVRDSFFMPLPYNTTGKLAINMDVKEWFQNPHTWDFTVYGGAIMQNQTAQNVLKENGSTVFRVKR
ncbi:MAG: hypothetical protein RR256_07720, partial [Bacteroidales bacterium]